MAELRELLAEQFPRQRESARQDKKGTSVIFAARGDHLAIFVVRANEEPKERLYLCRILQVVDNPEG